MLKIVYRSRFLTGVLLFAGVLGLTGLLASNARALEGHPKLFPVEVIVNFGNSGKPLHRETLYIEGGTTPKEAVSQVFPVLSGKTCCSVREVLAIDGVAADPAKNSWWNCLVNDSKKVKPQKSKLHRGDKLEWRYIEDLQ